ncbi:hypothetical protein [Brucella anthropi]|nr:hypothetical protein [Brucella anthropi]
MTRKITHDGFGPRQPASPIMHIETNVGPRQPTPKPSAPVTPPGKK